MKENTRKNKKYFVLTLLGFGFFVNPVFGFFDILPDCIGCILLFFGLTRLACLDSAIEKTRKIFLWFFAAEAVKLLLTPSVTASNVGSDKLAAVAVALVLEILFSFLACSSFFEGINYFSTRNGFSSTLSRTSSTAFLSYTFFFIRPMATFLPELYSMIELKLSADLYDFEQMDKVRLLLGTKPFVAVFLALVALVMGVIWFSSMAKTLKVFFAEAADTVSSRYDSEYKNVLQKTEAKHIRICSFLLCAAILFALDLSFDGIRIVPASVMFLGLFVCSFLLKSIFDFVQTRRLALPAFVLLAATEWYRYAFVRPDAVVLEETPLHIVAISAVLAVISSALCLLCVRCFLSELKGMSRSLTGKEPDTSLCWGFYCLLTLLRAEVLTLPYTAKWFSVPILFLSVAFVYCGIKAVTLVRDEDAERRSLFENDTGKP